MTATTRPLRADAARNRERVLAAAARVFSRRGVEASVAEIAVEAGVGKATIFRSYPTKDDLIAAVVTEKVRWVEDRTIRALDEPDAWEAFSRLLLELAELHAADHAHIGALARAVESVELDRAREKANAAWARLMERAKRQGAMRADASPADIRVLFGGVAAAMPADQRADAGAWRRWAELFAGALRA